VKPIFLGVEESLKHPNVPCGLKTDAERSRHVRKLVREMLNSRGEWEPTPSSTELPLREIKLANARTLNSENGDPQAEGGIAAPGSPPIHDLRSPTSELRSVLSEPAALEKIGSGTLVVLKEDDGIKTYGRAITVAERLNDNRVLIAKWIRRLTNWNGRQAPFAVWQEQIAPLVEQNFAKQKTPVIRFEVQEHKILAHVSLGDLTMRVPVDKYGVALWRPTEREVLPYDCAQCALVPVCKELSTSTGTALLWRRLNLVDGAGVPTRRGRMVSFFSQGDGLAIAAGLEDA